MAYPYTYSSPRPLWRNLLRPPVPSMDQMVGPAYQPKIYRPPAVQTAPRDPRARLQAGREALQAEWDEQRRAFNAEHPLPQPGPYVPPSMRPDSQLFSASERRWQSGMENDVVGAQLRGAEDQTRADMERLQAANQGLIDVYGHRRGYAPGEMPDFQRRADMYGAYSPQRAAQPGDPNTTEQANLGAAHSAWMAQNPQVGPGAPIDPDRLAYAQQRARSRALYRKGVATGTWNDTEAAAPGYATYIPPQYRQANINAKMDTNPEYAKSVANAQNRNWVITHPYAARRMANNRIAPQGQPYWQPTGNAA